MSTGTLDELARYTRILEDYVKPAVPAMLEKGRALSDVSYSHGSSVLPIEAYAIQLQAAIDDVCTKRAETRRVALLA